MSPQPPTQWPRGAASGPLDRLNEAGRLAVPEGRFRREFSVDELVPDLEHRLEMIESYLAQKHADWEADDQAHGDPGPDVRHDREREERICAAANDKLEEELRAIREGWWDAGNDEGWWS